MTPEELQIFKKNHEIEINKNNIKDIDKLEQKWDESLDYKKTKSEALKDITDPEFIWCKEKVYDIYNNLKNREWLSFKAFLTSYVAFSNAKKEKKIPKDDVFTVLDFSKPNNEERLFVIDLNMSDVVIKSKAWHGKNSWSKYAESFSNENWTNKSSVGLFITPNKSEKNSKGTWTGLRLQWLEEWINDNAASRWLFLHPASVTWSLGCITIPDKSLAKKLVSKLVWWYPIYIYTDKKKYLSSSKLLNWNTI